VRQFAVWVEGEPKGGDTTKIASVEGVCDTALSWGKRRKNWKRET